MAIRSREMSMERDCCLADWRKGVGERKKRNG